jgi:hypothetical protein
MAVLELHNVLSKKREELLICKKDISNGEHHNPLFFGRTKWGKPYGIYRN